MFKSVTHLGLMDNGEYRYNLVDSAFSEQLSFTKEQYHHMASVAYELLIIRAYEQRRLPVATNLAMFYLQFFRAQPQKNAQHDLEAWRRELDRHFPEIQYTDKYYPCMRKQLKRFSYGAI